MEFVKRIMNVEPNDISFLNKIDQELYWVYRNSNTSDLKFNILISNENLEIISTYGFENKERINSLPNIRTVLKCSNGDVLIVAQLRNSVEQTNALILLRINSNNEVLWSKEYFTDTSVSFLQPTGTSVLELLPNKILVSTSKLIFTIDQAGNLLKKVSIRDAQARFANIEISKINSEQIFVLMSVGTKRSTFSILDFELNTIEIFSFKGIDFLEDSKFTKIGDNLFFISKSDKSTSKHYLYSFNPSLEIPNTIQAKTFVEDRIRGLSTTDFIQTIGNEIIRITRAESNKHSIRKFSSNLESIESSFLEGSFFLHTQTSDSAAISTIGGGYYLKSTNLFSNSPCLNVNLTSNLVLENEELQKINVLNPIQDLYDIEIRNINFELIPADHFEFIKTCPVVLSFENSTITADPLEVGANGILQSKVTVRLIDEEGDLIRLDGYNVNIHSTSGEVSSTVKGDNDAFTATISFSENDFSAYASFTVNHQLSPKTVFIKYLRTIPISPTAQIQSPHLYLQAAGSTDGDGDESTPGIHLRWTFKNKLGDEHLPKGNLATGTANFNKPGDYVKVYRAPYQKEQITLSLADEPQTIDHSALFWLYEVNGNKFYVIFRERERYLAVLETIDPREGNRLSFLAAYGDGLIEIESRDELAFGIELMTSGVTSTSKLETELLAVEANRLSIAKNVIARKTFDSRALIDTHQLGDNIRSVRLRATNCQLSEIKIELYQTFLFAANDAQNWVSLGDFALTTTDEEAFQRLEQTPGTVHGKWPRFNNDCLANLDNYRDKWNGPREAGDRNLKQIVEQYIQLSNSEDNPRAVETLEFSDPNFPSDLRDLQEISNLNLLFLAGIDYHMARMMGLGHLDTSLETDDQKYIYLAEYHTQADLGSSFISGESATEEVQHLYLTIPTSKQDSRLPYPVDLQKIEPGISRVGLDENSTLTSPDGYTEIGRQRYLSVFAKEPIEHENESFYETSTEFNYSEATHPVYGGISYREKGKDWVKPEISSTADYLSAGPDPASETVPLNIPFAGEPLFIHRVIEEGTHEYLGYGINWFGRSSRSLDPPISIRTEFPISNLLKPPASLNAVHIVTEDPLFLTSANEQIRLGHNMAADNTLVRLMFSYNHEQEQITYALREEDRAQFTEAELLVPDLYRPDQQELFANELEVFFRDRIPQNIRGKIASVTDDPNDQAIAVLTTGKYILYSSGEEIEPRLPENIPVANFTGGVLVIGEQQFIIHSAQENSMGYVNFKVYKKTVGDALRGDNTDGPLEIPVVTGEEIFMAIENMLTVASWGDGNPQNFKIKIPEEVSTIHRALVETSGGSSLHELQLEKFRGIVDDAVTITPLLETSEVDENNQETAAIHRGTYRIQLSQSLAQHPQFSSTGNSVEWQGGSVRIPSAANPKGSKRVLKVVKIENVGTESGLVLYAIDDTFDQEIIDPATGKITGYQSDDPILTTGDFTINFYPGYQVYLYADSSFGLTKEALSATNGEQLKYTLFGTRAKADEYRFSEDNPPVFVETHFSNIGVPATMFSQAVVPPLRPQLPTGSDYATRPDTFGKATYTLSTQFDQKPFAIQYIRADEQGILNAIYEPTTIQEIRIALSAFSTDAFAADRWKNLLGFDYSSHGGEFGKFPDTENGYRFPNPDKAVLFQLINFDINEYNREENTGDDIAQVVAGTLSPSAVIIPGRENDEEQNDTTLVDYIKQAILTVFIPMTEIPLIYDQIEDDPKYQPINKKQVIRAKNGSLLKPTDETYDIAPMAKRIGTNKVQFTDFTLDGTSSNVYFYSVRELSSTMQMSDFSPVIGPVNLVNTNPPEPPQIRRTLPRLASKDHGLKQVSLEFVSVENLTILGESIVHEGGLAGGATSRQILEGNWTMSFRFGAGSEALVGLSTRYTNKESSTIGYGWLANESGGLRIKIKDEQVSVGNYEGDTLLQIQRVGNQFCFLKNSEKVYQITIETPNDFLVSVSAGILPATVNQLTLYSSGNYYDKEVLRRNTEDPLPITITNLENADLSADGTLSKKVASNAWDTSAISLEFLPLYGALSFRVKANEEVAAGLAAFNTERHFSSIEYGIRTGNDGLLYVVNKGENIVTGVPYEANSLLTLERRNQQLLFKHEGRTFYQLKLESNVLMWADFAIFSEGGILSAIEINETSGVDKNYLSSETTAPGVQLEFNSYPVSQKITTLSLYRTLDPAKSSSVRSMDLVKEIDLRLAGQLGQSVLKITDEFEDLAQVPYGSAIFYRATVSRQVTYNVSEENRVVTELAPSKSSNLIISTITESTNPPTPELFYFLALSASDTSGENILLNWRKTANNPRYLIFKMNEQGNWVKIHEFESNEDDVILRLVDTSLTADELSAIDGNSSSTFHHFRVDVENSGGLFNLEKNQLTIPSDKLIE